MADLASFFVRLGTIFDGSGLKQAQASFKATGESADQLTGGLKGIASTVAGGAAIWKLIDFSREALEAFGNQERAERRLELAMQNLGVFTRRAHRDQVAFAEALQRTTTLEDDQVIETQALLTTFGLYGDQLKEVTKAAADLSAGLGVSLNTSTLLLGKAFAGETSTLQRYGIKIQDTGRIADNFAQVIGQVNSRFGGAAEAELNTYLGRLKNLSNNFGDLKEKVGAFLIGPAEQWTKWLSKGIDKLNEMADGGAQEKLTNSRDKELVSIRAHIQTIKDEMDAHGKNTVKYALLEKDLARAAEGYRILSDAKRKAAAARPPEEEEKQKKPRFAPRVFTDAEEKSREKTMQEAEALYAEAEGADADRSERAKVRKVEEVAFKLEAEGRYGAASLLRSVALQKAEELLNKKRLANVGDTLGTIATLSTSSNKTLAAIGKAAAISQATIDTYLGVAKAWALGPIIGPPLAGLVLVAGLANVAKIAAVGLKKGGVAQSTPGGIMANIAEGGEDEAVTPLNEAAGRKLGIRPGMGGNTLVMHQTNYFGGAAGEQGGVDSIEKTAERLRLATRDGVAELIDLSKEIYETGRARAGEA